MVMVMRKVMESWVVLGAGSESLVMTKVRVMGSESPFVPAQN